MATFTIEKQASTTLDGWTVTARPVLRAEGIVVRYDVEPPVARWRGVTAARGIDAVDLLATSIDLDVVDLATINAAITALAEAVK
jgi:hypothetical protein